VQPHYLVRASAQVAEAWSTTRLQFEPKGWQRELRAEMRAAIAGLVSREEPLSAHYRSPVRERSDTENILFYNVGTGAFAAASAAGVRYERGFVVPPCAADLDGAPFHYHRYETGADARFQFWRERAELAHFDWTAMPRLSAASSPAGIWLALHAKPAQVIENSVWTGMFALRLRLSLPPGRAAPVSLLKPLLDGVISAFSVYEGTQLALVAERLASQLGLDAATAAELLTRRSQALLGPCPLLVPAERAGLNGEGEPRLRVHDLRHTFASHLIVDLHLDVAQVSRILGHARPSVTLDTYTHLFDQAAHAAEIRERMARSEFGGLLAEASVKQSSSARPRLRIVPTPPDQP
jgi:hypothetical protein